MSLFSIYTHLYFVLYICIYKEKQKKSYRNRSINTLTFTNVFLLFIFTMIVRQIKLNDNNLSLKCFNLNICPVKLTALMYKNNNNNSLPSTTIKTQSSNGQNKKRRKTNRKKNKICHTKLRLRII